jgi:hypothetical protein
MSLTRQAHNSTQNERPGATEPRILVYLAQNASVLRGSAQYLRLAAGKKRGFCQRAYGVLARHHHWHRAVPGKKRGFFQRSYGALARTLSTPGLNVCARAPKALPSSTVGKNHAFCRRQRTRAPPQLFAANELIEFDLDVYARWQFQLHERIHGLVRGIQDVHEALMGTQLELVARVLVGVR